MRRSEYPGRRGRRSPRRDTLGLSGLALLALLVTAVAPGVFPAHAQNPIPPAAEPGRESPEGFGDRDTFGGFTLELLVPDSRREMPPEEAEQISFTLNELVIEGMTVYDPAEMSSIWAELIGQDITLLDLFLVADQIERRYRADDYIISRAFVPAQRVGDGRFRIQVVEGYVSDVTLQGDASGVSALLEYYLSNVKEERPLTASTLERYLLLANDVGGVAVSGVLRPSAGEVGAAELLVSVAIDHYEGFVGVDNRASKFTGPNTLSVGGSSSAFTPAGEQLSAIGLITEDWDELRYGRLSFSRKVGTAGTEITFRTDYSTSEPGSNLNTLDDTQLDSVDRRQIRNKNLSFEGVISHPILRSRRENLTLEGSFVYRNTKTKVIELQRDEVNEFSDTLSKDRIRKLVFGFQYEKADAWDGVSSLQFDWHQGLRILGVTREGGLNKDNDPDTVTPLSRGDAAIDFTKFTIEVARLQRLLYGFQLFLNARGQLGPDRLLASEEFGVGGSSIGRGYAPFDISGDDGFAASAELRFIDDFDDPFWGLESYELYGFYDFGVTWNKDVLNQKGTTEESGRDSLASMGFGVRSTFDVWGTALDINLELAVPLTRVPVGRERRRNEPRIYFEVNSQF